MKNLVKRLTAALLLVCTLVSFIVPATFADTTAGDATVYDFDLGNSTDPVISQYNMVDKLSRTLNFKNGTSTGKTGWKLLEEMYADPACSLNWKGEAFGASTNQSKIVADKTGLYIYTGGNDTTGYLVLRLAAPKTGAGTYNISLTSTDARNTIDVYLLDAADYTTPEAAMTSDNKIFTGLVTNETHTTEAPVTLDGGEMILIFNTTTAVEKDRHVVNNVTLLPVETDAPESTTQATPTTTAQDEEATAIIYDLEVYNNSRYDAMIGGKETFALNRNAFGTLDGAYTTAQTGMEILANDYPSALNWKIEALADTMTAANLVLYASANTGIRIRKDAPASGTSYGWIAFRLDVPEEGTYDLGLVTESTMNPNETYMFPASAASMTVAEIEAKMTENNLVGTHSWVNEPGTLTYSDINVAEGGAYILVVKTPENTGRTTIYLSQIVLTSVADSTDTTVTTTPETTSETTNETTNETTKDTTVPEETTNQTTVPGSDTPLYTDGVYDLEIYNYDRYAPMVDNGKETYALSGGAAKGLEGAYKSGDESKDILEADYPAVLNWKVEAVAECMTYINLTLYKTKNTGVRIQKPAADEAKSGWVAFRIVVPQSGKFDLNAVNEDSWVAHSVYLFPADYGTSLEAQMKPENLIGSPAATSLNTPADPHIETYYGIELTAGEYIIAFKMPATVSKSTIYLSKLELVPASGQEAPTEPSTQPTEPVELIPGGPKKDNYFDLELYRYDLFKNMAGSDVSYTKNYNATKTVAQYMDANYPENMNWNIEGIAQDGVVMFQGNKNYGMRAEIGANNYIAFRVNISKAANYNVIFRSTYTLYEYNATAYLVPAPESKMTPEQITAAITEDNKLGTYSHTYKIQSAAILDQKVEAAGEYVLILVIGENVSSAKKGRLYLSSIEFREIGADATKEEKDKVIYDFDLLAKDPDIRQNTLTSWDNDEHTIRVSDRIAQWYQNGELQWMYEGKSETSIAEAVREKYLRFKATEDMLTVEDAWTAFRLRAPGTGKYDVRLTGIEKNVMVVNIYLIPAVTGVTMSTQQIKERMTKENLLIEKARISGEDTFYLGEYTFGAEQEYLLVLEFVRGTRLNLVSIEMTRDGLVADGTLPVGKAVPGVVYDFDICDPFEGAFYKEKRYYMADIQDELNARYNSGAQNWKWINASNTLVSADTAGNTIPGGYLRFYREGGMYVYGEQDAWVAFKIKSPGDGDFTVSMNHAICPDSGTVAMYILPADTDVDKLWEATDPANRVGMVTLTNDTGLSGKEDGFTSFVGYYNFEAGKEYILLLEGYAASRYNTARANMNISQIFMEKGIKEYEAQEEVKAVNPINVAPGIISVADSGNGNFAMFEMNGMDYYLVQLEGGAIYLYNLSTGELEDEQFVQGSRPRHMQVAADGTIWLTNAWKFLVRYDPVNKTIEKTRTYLPSEFKHNGFSFMTLDEEGIIYAALNNIGHVVKYDPYKKIYTDLGVIRGVTDTIGAVLYKDGYLYIQCVQSGQYNCVVKFNLETGKTESICEFYELSGDVQAYGIGMLGEDILAVGIATTDNNCAITIDINTMELVDLGLPGPINYCVSEEIDGKQYMISSSYGLYEYDVATGVVTKVPGFSSMSASGFRSGASAGGHGKSWATINGDFCLVSNLAKEHCCPRVINMDRREYYEWRDLTRGASGGGSEIISLTTGAEGANEVIMGFWNAHYAATYNTETGTITNICDTAGQTDTIGYYKDILYAGCYSATVLVELDRERNEYTQRFKLDHEITQQKRLFSIEFGDDKVFVGSIPDTNCNGGSLTVYDTITGQWYSERNLIPDQSIIDEAYWNKVVFITSGRAGGSNTVSMGGDAVILAYDYENRKTLATLDITKYIPNLPRPVEYMYGLTADPNAEENGRIWAVVADTLFCFTFDKQTNTFDVQTVLSFERSAYNTSGGVSRQQSKLQFIKDKNQLYVVFKDSGTYCLTLEDWDAPIGKVKITSKERIMSHKPEDYIIAEDGNMYFGVKGDLMMLPLNVTAEDWAIAKHIDDQIMAIGEVTLESEAAIKNARSAYENLSYYYKALVQKLYVLEEAEVDLLECKIAQWDGKEIVADDVTALQELMDTYKPLNNRQKRYVKNYLLLRSSYDQADKLNDQRIAAAMQEKVDALKDIMPIETLEKEPQVVAVRTELSALEGAQQYLVDKTILEEAEAQVAVLRAAFVKQVEALIQAIPAEITLDAEPAIVAAREGADKLYALERKQVSYSKLETAESKLRNLKNALQKAEEFDALMKEIGIVTLSDAERIANARKAYNSLNETARTFCKKAGKLNRAEFILFGLQTWMIPVIVVVDAAAIFAVLWFVPSLHNKVFKTKKKEEAEVTDD